MRIIKKASKMPASRSVFKLSCHTSRHLWMLQMWIGSQDLFFAGLMSLISANKFFSDEPKKLLSYYW